MKNVFIIILLLIPVTAIAQDDSLISNYFQKGGFEDAYKYLHNRNIRLSIIDSTKQDQVDTIYYVYRLLPENNNILFQKEDFFNNRFLQNLGIRYYKDYKENIFVPIDVYLPCDSLGWIIEGNYKARTKFGLLYDQYLLNLLRNHNMDCIFYTEFIYRVGHGYSGLTDLFFGVRGSQLYIIYLFNCIPIEDFLDWGYDFMVGNTDEYPKKLQTIYNEAYEQFGHR